MNKRLPTRLDAVIFAAKASVHRLLRSCRDLLDFELRRWPAVARPQHYSVAGKSSSLLRMSEAQDQRQLILGKIENLRVAVRSIHGIEVPANGVFSFWAQLGRPSARRGYVPGRELREGCVIPSIGGGLCQLSNALYQAATDAGLEIVERRAHSQIVEGSAAELGRDATVFWNYVDLRFRHTEPFWIEASMDGEQLHVAILKKSAAPVLRKASVIPLASGQGRAPASCETCGQEECFRRADLLAPGTQRRAAYLLDAVSPEFDTWVSAGSGERSLFLPLDGLARGKPQYRWTTSGFFRVKTFPLLTLWRALASRVLAQDAAVRQRSNFAFRERLARAYAKSLHYLDEHIVVTQELLPHLWQLGALQGRSFDVLMPALPMKHLQKELDQAFLGNPSSTTLADFRAPAALLAAEELALKNASRIITPHHAVALLFRNASLLPWSPPPAASVVPGPRFRVLFPAATLGRKGAYELRAAAHELKLPLTLMGPVLEAAGFWDGIKVEFVSRTDKDWLREVAVVVLPSWIEGRPAQLLQALQAGIPVIASAACGLPPQPGLTLIAAGDIAALKEALRPYAD
jgi:glycosyltransferase involved in cell wall biosynthesis